MFENHLSRRMFYLRKIFFLRHMYEPNKKTNEKKKNKILYLFKEKYSTEEAKD
jgi:hypothetical protein